MPHPGAKNYTFYFRLESSGLTTFVTCNYFSYKKLDKMLKHKRKNI